MTTTVSSKGQVVLPAEFRRRDGIEPGHEFEVERLGAGVYRLTLSKPPKNHGLVGLLLSCPVKDWYVPVPTGPGQSDCGDGSHALSHAGDAQRR